MDFLELYKIVASKLAREKKLASTTDSTFRQTYGRVDAYKNVGKNSIKYKTRESIAQYPILISQDISMDTQVMLMHSFEVQNASLVSMLLTNIAHFDGNTVGDVVRDFHNNPGTVEGLVQSTPSMVHLNSTFLPGVELETFFNECNKELLLTNEDKIKHETVNEINYTRDMRNLVKEQITLNEATKKSAEITNKGIKEANDMTPTIVEVEVNMGNDENNKVSKLIKIGVKCVLHPLSSDDIEYHLSKAVYKDTPLMRLIKWTTGEISFFKGLLFAVEDAKRSAQMAGKGSSDQLKQLEIVSAQAKASAIGGGKYNPTPITTLIVSKTDVDNIKFKHGIDLIGKPANIAKIFDRFFLMNFVIVDEALDVAYVYNEMKRTLDRYPMRSFERVAKIRKIKPDEVYNFIK